MSIKSTTESIIRGLDQYREFLSDVSEEEFQRSPAEGVWSYSEVYSHILQSNFGSLIAIERCVYGNKSLSGRTGLMARFVLLLGRLPGKFKAPEKLASLVKKITIEEARNDIIKLEKKLLEVVPAVKDAPSGQKIPHPRFGVLNARQWLRFIEIHTWHHLKQLERIKKLFLRNS